MRRLPEGSRRDTGGVSVTLFPLAPGIPSQVGVYKIYIHFEAYVHESIIFSPPPLPVLPTLLHGYCTTFAQYTTPLRPPLCMPCTVQYWSWQYRVTAKSQADKKLCLGSTLTLYLCTNGLTRDIATNIHVCICVYICDYIHLCMDR